MNRFHNLQNERQVSANNYNIPNKSTVKKQLSNRFSKLNQLGKQNSYHHGNLLVNLNKQTVRKNIQNNVSFQESQCANHPDRVSEYIVQIDGQVLAYCRKCATHIASQGFDVHKIGSPQRRISKVQSPSILLDNSSDALLPNISPNRGRQSNPRKQQRIQNQKRTELLGLVKKLKSLKLQYSRKQRSLTQISETFQSQKQVLNSYYDELISYIEEIREIHFQAIDQSAINTVQVCEIEKGQIQETLCAIDQMVTDIECNLDSIIFQVNQKNYAECFEYYKQKECIFSHRLEELGSEAKPWPCSTQEQLNQKIHHFKTFVNELHQVGDQQHQNEPNETQQPFLF